MRYRFALAGLFLLGGAAGAAEPAPPEIPCQVQIPALPDGYHRSHRIDLTWQVGENPFGQAPVPGIHPRVLIGPDELPALRRRLRETACGQRAWNAIGSWTGFATRPQGPLTAAVQALVDGDLAAPDKVTDAWWRPNLPLYLNLAGFRALIAEDTPAQQRLAQALHTYVRALLAHPPPAPKGRPASWEPLEGSIGYAYDWLYHAMNETQRHDIRAYIAKCTAGRSSHGMGMKPEDRTYNWMPEGMKLCLYALAIEGEPGYDPSVYARSVPVMRDFLTYGIYADGTPREGTHYFNYGMGTNGALSLIAMARRGDNLLQHPHLRAVVQWYAQVIEPFGFAFAMHGDTPNDNGGLLANYVLMKNLWPKDPVVDWIWRNRMGDTYSKLNYRGDFLAVALFPQDWQAPQAPAIPEATPNQWGVEAGSTDTNVPGALAAPWNAPALGLPLDYLSPERGFLVSRTGWEREALALSVECRRDALGPGHNHSNQNDFTLSALGRKWVIDRGFHVAETAHHSGILIDGLGQGNFAAPGRFVTYLNSDLGTVVTGDARDAYSYRHTFPWRIGNPENKGFGWRPSPFGSSAAAALYNPVEYAYRTVLLVRGPQPYVLIFDDLRKDAAPHLYQWLLQLPSDLQLQSVKAHTLDIRANGDDPQAPSLRVQVIEPVPHSLFTGLDLACERYEIKRTPESGSKEDFGLGTRVVVAGRAVAWTQVTLLCPQAAKAEAPQVASSADGFSIDLPGQHDVYHLTRQAGHATAFSLDRNDGQACLSVGLRQGALGPKASFKVTGTPVALAWQNGTLSLSGSGWRHVAVNGLRVTEVRHDGSVQHLAATPKGVELTGGTAAAEDAE